MNELLQAAKAVIDADFVSQQRVAIENLRAAVERAEKQEAMGFGEWWYSNDYGNYGIHHAQLAWIAAQQAERERCREIVITMGGPDVPDLLRQIDSGEE